MPRCIYYINGLVYCLLPMHRYLAVALQSHILHTGAQFHSIHPTCSLLHYRTYSDSVGIHCRLHTCLFPKQQDLSNCDTVLLNPAQDRSILTRHKKSSPARSNGIDLNVVLLPAGGRVTGSCTTSSSSHSDRDTERPRIATRREAVPEGQTGR